MIQIISISTQVCSIPSPCTSATSGQIVPDDETDGVGTDSQYPTGHTVCHLEPYNADLLLTDREIEVLSLILIAYDDPDELIQSLPKIKEVMKQVLTEKQTQI